jgi:hypothetical protein
MSCSILLEKEEEQEEYQGSQLEQQGIPVCGANLSSPVVDQANYIDEIHYRIGNRVYRKCRLIIKSDYKTCLTRKKRMLRQKET